MSYCLCSSCLAAYRLSSSFSLEGNGNGSLLDLHLLALHLLDSFTFLSFLFLLEPNILQTLLGLSLLSPDLLSTHIAFLNFITSEVERSLWS